MVKFNKRLSEYDAILGVDLALYNSGISCYDIHSGKFTELSKIVVKNTEEDKFLNLFLQLKNLFQNLLIKYKKIMVIQERMPSQCGGASTIQTLQSLSGAHAIMHLAISMTEGVELYDNDGIHSISVKTLFKTEQCPKPSKKDIRKAVVEMYGLDDSKLTDDISDSVAVVHTLLTKKWNQDIDEQIKGIKKEIKTLKMEHAKQERLKEIERLIELKI